MNFTSDFNYNAEPPQSPEKKNFSNTYESTNFREEDIEGTHKGGTADKGSSKYSD